MGDIFVKELIKCLYLSREGSSSLVSIHFFGFVIFVW